MGGDCVRARALALGLPEVWKEGQRDRREERKRGGGLPHTYPDNWSPAAIHTHQAIGRIRLSGFLPPLSDSSPTPTPHLFTPHQAIGRIWLPAASVGWGG